MKITRPKHNWQAYKFGSISLCMIMRDNAKTLARCLNSMRGLVNEIIIVDTGSKDNSVEIAKSFGATVIYDTWQDDFSRPRNIGIEQAKGDWIFIMDPDEVISRDAHNSLRWLTRAKNFSAFWITTRNYSPATREPSYRRLPEGKDPSGKFPGFTPSTKTRLFKNGLGIKFEGCWHELVDWYLIRMKIPIGTSNVVVHHWNHEITQKSIKEKGEWYLKLGEKKVKEWPTHGQAWWELAVAEMIQGLRVRASHSIAMAFKYGFGTQSQFFSLARCQNMIGNKNRSRLSFEKGICALFPTLTHIDPSRKQLKTLLEGL